MSGITLSRAVRSNLLNLQSTADLLSRAQERLSTGLRVNSAIDSPTNYFTALSLNSRASDLSQLLDSAATAVQTINAADAGVTSSTKLLDTAQATARQALQTSDTITTAAAAAVATSSVTGLTATDVSEDAGFADGASLTITGGGFNNVSIDFADDGSEDIDSDADTVQDIIDLINTQAGATIASLSSGGALKITGQNTTANITIGGTNSGGLSSATVTAATTSANPKRAELVDTYNAILDQITDMARDSGYNGVNLLNGDSFSVLFNEDGSSKLVITGEVDDAAGLGLAALGSTAFDANTGINDTLDDLRNAVDDLRVHASKLGSSLSVIQARREFTTNMIDVLQKGASNLTLADANTEAADVLALQTRQQLSSTALSLASQADQNVLRLF
jgi:flagellin-like hook-associated protein FlgL